MFVNTTQMLTDTTEFNFEVNDTDSNATTAAVPPGPIPQPMAYPGVQMYYDAITFSYVYNYLAYSLGIPGNVMTVILLIRMKPLNSSSIWLLAMALCDLLNLLTRVMVTPMILEKVIVYDIPLCQFVNMIIQSTEHSNYVFLLAMTSERVIAVWFPLKMSSWCTVRRAVIAAPITYLLILISDFHLIETMYVTPIRNMCYFKPNYISFWNLIYHDRVQASLFRIIPLFAVILFNILIAVKVGMAKAIQQKMSDDQLKEKQKQQRQIFRLLTVATAFYFLSTCPDIILRLTHQYWGDRTKSWAAARDYMICLNVFTAFRVGNHAGNFYLYIIAARKFRGEFLHLITRGNYGEHNGAKGKLLKVGK